MKRKLHNTELSDLYSSPNIIVVIKSRRMRWVGHVALIGVMKGANRVLEENLREGDHLEYPGIRWEVNIKMYLQEVGFGGGGSCCLA